ncbi:hypothetical protein DL768_010491 [Monosporascus sp. mg162]|nr:hypothetical protein DL768_010491 [Monosporascus sp. mg162]
MQIFIIITITTSSTKTITTNTITINRTAAACVRAARAEQLAAERSASAAADVAVAAEAAAAAAAAAADAAPPVRTSEPAARAAPETPRRTPRQRPAQGARRAEPCLGYLRSALAGCSNGVCFDAAVGSRCWRYAFGHTCTPVYILFLFPLELFPLLTADRSPANVRPLAVRLVKALKNEAPRRDIDRLRASIRVLLEGGGGEEN